MTHVEQQILEFVRTYTGKFGYPPSYDEIAHHIGRSRTSAFYHCTKLIRMGRLIKIPRKVRTLRVVKYDDQD